MVEKLKGFFYKLRIAPTSSRIMFITGIFLFFLIVFLYAVNFFVGYSAIITTGDKLSPLSPEHIMGTDHLGRDVFSRVCHGTGFSLSIAFLAVAISLTIGAPIGVLSGYFGGIIDRILSIIFDALYAFPGIILAILIRISIGPGIIPTAVAISVGFIPQYFRVVRSSALSLKERPFIEALRTLGAGHKTLIHHIFIYTIPSVTTIATLNMAEAILSVAGLGFLGLGLPPPTPEWGTDLGRGRDFITAGVWWQSTFPGLFIMIAVLAFTLIGESLNEIRENISYKTK